MKITYPIFVALALISFATPMAQARVDHYSQATSSDSSSLPMLMQSDVRHYGVGLATASALTLTTTAITGWMDITPDTGLQGFLGFEATSPVLMGGGLLLKHKVLDSQGAGFHIGGGFGMGSGPTPANATPPVGPTSFFLTLTALGGFHFAVPGAPHLIAQLDGGPALTIISGVTNFTLGGLSPALGISVLYIF